MMRDLPLFFNTSIRHPHAFKTRQTNHSSCIVTYIPAVVVQYDRMIINVMHYYFAYHNQSGVIAF